jgi:alkanesulfonate monooxygenase SsuD/methylene tetrahydromethanopterin reductase-like flavin-dependent oxidoreductase (luciferase family)
MTTVVMRFDFRCPPGNATPAEELYRAALEMAAYADGRGVDVLGRGRLMVIAGIGYREQEYHALGRDWARRGKQLELSLDILRQAWRGEPFDYRGQLITVLPRPCSRPHPLIAVGGNSVIAARRAARLQLPFFPGIDDQSLVDAYNEECRRRSYAGGFVMLPNYPSTTYIAEDVEAGWREIGEYMLYDALAYGAWRHDTRRAYAESFARDLASLREEGKYRVLSPEQAVAVIRQTGSLHLSPLVGGCPPALGWKSLRLFTEQVAPHIRSQEDAQA